MQVFDYGCHSFHLLKTPCGGGEPKIAAVMDLIVGGLLVIIGLVVWGFVYSALCTAVLDSSVLSIVGLIPLIIAAGFLIRGFLGMFS